MSVIFCDNATLDLHWYQLTFCVCMCSLTQKVTSSPQIPTAVAQITTVLTAIGALPRRLALTSKLIAVKRPCQLHVAWFHLRSYVERNNVLTLMSVLPRWLDMIPRNVLHLHQPARWVTQIALVSRQIHTLVVPTIVPTILFATPKALDLISERTAARILAAIRK